jgi:hypothetical protein
MLSAFSKVFGTIVVASTLLGVILFFGQFWEFIQWIFEFVKRQFIYSDFAVGLLRHTHRLQSHTLHLKTVYAGKSPAIWDSTKITANLKPVSALERLASWVRVIIAYLIYDVEGLEAVFGTLPQLGLNPVPWRINQNAIVRRLYCILNGLLVADVAFSMLASPFVLLFFDFYLASKFPNEPLDPVSSSILTLFIVLSFIIAWSILFSGPFGKFSLVTEPDPIELKDSNGTNLIIPFLLNPGEQSDLSFKFVWHLKALGFPRNTNFSPIPTVQPSSWWRLPRRTQFVMRSSAEIEIRLKGRLRHYPIRLSSELIRIG